MAGALDRAAVRFGDPADDGQTESDAAILAGTRLSGAIEAFEDASCIVRRDADPGVGNPQSNGGGAGVQRCRYLASRRRIAESVIQQVDYQAAQQLLVAVELQVVTWKTLELEAECMGESLNGAATVA